MPLGFRLSANVRLTLSVEDDRLSHNVELQAFLVDRFALVIRSLDEASSPSTHRVISSGAATGGRGGKEWVTVPAAGLASACRSGARADGERKRAGSGIWLMPRSSSSSEESQSFRLVPLAAITRQHLPLAAWPRLKRRGKKVCGQSPDRARLHLVLLRLQRSRRSPVLCPSPRRLSSLPIGGLHLRRKAAQAGASSGSGSWPLAPGSWTARSLILRRRTGG